MTAMRDPATRRETVRETGSAEETFGLGMDLGSRLRAGDVIALVGPLGSGKTCFTKGVARGLGVPDDEAVMSPTFVYLRIHRGRIPLYHVDAYRLHGAEDFLGIGGWEVVGEDGVAVIEWADRIGEALPPDRLDIRLEISGETRRRLVLSPRGGVRTGILPGPGRPT